MRGLIIFLMIGKLLMATVVDKFEVNGVDVPLIIEKENRLPIVSLQLVFKNSGSIEDSIAGLAKMSAKMMNEGTLKRGSSGFADALEDKAIHLSASAGTETFVLELDTLKEELPSGLTLFKELLEEPNLTKESLAKVQTTTIGALTRKESDFDYVAQNELKAILFKDSPLAKPSSGTIESVEATTLKDISTFIDSHFNLNNLIVVAGGDIDVNALKKELAILLESIKKQETKALLHVEVNAKPSEVILKKKTEQAYIYFGSPYNLAFNDDDVYKAKVATFILGSSGFGSRLMEEIRVKRGLAYSAYARVSFAKSSTYFMGYLQTKLESLDEAKSTVNEVIELFLKEGVTQDELDQAKRFLSGSEPLRVETMSQRLSRTFMEYYKGEELGSSKRELAKIEALSLADLNAFIKQHQEIKSLSYAIITQ